MLNAILRSTRHWVAGLVGSVLVCLSLLPAHAASTFTPTSAFSDNGDGTVTHHLTGLTWMRCSLGQTWTGTGCTGTVNTYTLDQARVLTSNFDWDWRLPTPWELATIVDYTVAYPGPAINRTVFPDTPGMPFWSGTPGVFGSDFAWVVHFGNGYANYDSYRYYYHYAVRLVRGGWSFGALTTPNVDFTDWGDGTVTHLRTGLHWTRCFVGQTWTGSSCAGTAGNFTWDQARALTSSLAGFYDWRLPDAQELQSIVEYGFLDPAINSAVFPGIPSWSNGTTFPEIPSTNVWTGSPYAYYSNGAWTNGAWSVNFASGNAFGYGRSNRAWVRLVRGGQYLDAALECTFNWLEDQYPSLLSPRRPVTQTMGPYTLRAYTGTLSYLGFSSIDRHLYYVSLTTSLSDWGQIDGWAAQAGCQ